MMRAHHFLARANAEPGLGIARWLRSTAGRAGGRVVTHASRAPAPVVLPFVASAGLVPDAARATPRIRRAPAAQKGHDMARATPDPAHGPAAAALILGLPRARTAHAPAAFWYPPWLAQLSVAAWLSTPGLRLAWVNARAEALLGRPDATLVGRSCAGVIAGRDRHDAPLCSSHCPLRLAALHRRAIEPFELRLGAPPAPRAQLLVIPLTGPDHSRPWLLHCVTARDQPTRAERFLARVAARSSGAHGPDARHRLTPREAEILELLCADRDLPAVAATLGVSYVTIRNHVQNILRKLGAHSVLEAVARYLV
jgi:DNA-binding CsgD family transcriptional regulator